MMDATNKENAKQYDGPLHWTSALDQMVLDKIIQIYLFSIRPETQTNQVNTYLIRVCFWVPMRRSDVLYMKYRVIKSNCNK